MGLYRGPVRIMSRFFADKKNIFEDHIVLTDKEDVKHLSKVLRHRIGDVIEISDNDSMEYEIELTAITPEKVIGHILDAHPFEREPKTRVTLYQGIPKQSKMELIIQKTVELGVDTVLPVFTERTVVQDRGHFGKKTERWQKIASEAVKQCRRGLAPTVGPAVTLDEVRMICAENDLNLLCYEDEKQTTLKEVLRREKEKAPQKIGLIIGPEGGFSESEVRKLTEAGAVSVSLGKTILRVETASVAALAMIMYELELDGE